MSSNIRALAIICHRRGKEGRQFFSSQMGVWDQFSQNFCKFFSDSTPESFNREKDSVLEQLSNWDTKLGIRATALGEDDYPWILAQVSDPPPIIFYQGELSLCSKKQGVAVVGSRKASAEGCQIARDFGFAFALNGINVISGLAYGIDAAAHQGALKGSDSSTTAVLGGGLSKIYPAQNRSLADKILNSGGVLLSQFEPEQLPRPHQFLDRNRVVSGLSSGVVIVQAAKRSGALSTANHALEQGREIFAIPGSICSPLHAGCNKLIRDGAGLVSSPADVMEALQVCVAPNIEENRPTKAGVDQELKPLLQYIAQEQPVALTNLMEDFKLAQLHQFLLKLELAELIIYEPGGKYRATQKGVCQLG